MKLYIFEVENWEREAFDKLSGSYEISFVEETLSADNATDYADAEGISTFIYSQLTRETLDALPHLGIIASRSTGVDHIDMDTCKERGITVCNVPSYGRNTVAEHVFGLLLMISHRLEEAVDRTRKGDFSPRGLTGFDLRGKTIGVIGTGDIGKAAIGIAAGFGMKVLAFDIKPDTSAARELGFNYVDLDTLLENADVITVHLPSTPKTRDFIGEPQFAKMKPGAVLINTARGDIVNITALAKALAEGKLSAAGLDVLPGEPVMREDTEVLRSVYEQKHDLASLLADEVLLRMRNVVVTPHSAFNTREAVERILSSTIDNLELYAQDQQPDNVVAT
ncbi:hydroxyacid dehydrogenase [Kineobactrum sediminis]|uniref:Hydroxyacid dehydrogenase n=1 Tax=Kineobactrum sediminis TaxID=1905677 RepID=A0A2N5Y180_9GAMM|nr:hydroxyacid dehydrogenase [Kineobactrum sediminis]PLW82119.1 hydroxyacid dehydrogenase [Kineobactrum sediminis]